MPAPALSVQVFYQGILVSIASLVFYGSALDILGVSGGAAFGALVPALSGLFAIPPLAEWPNPTDWSGMLLICVGVYLASGGPVPRISTGSVSVASSARRLRQAGNRVRRLARRQSDA